MVNRRSNQHLHFLLAFQVLKESDESDRMATDLLKGVQGQVLDLLLCVCVSVQILCLSHNPASCCSSQMAYHPSFCQDHESRRLFFFPALILKRRLPGGELDLGSGACFGNVVSMAGARAIWPQTGNSVSIKQVGMIYLHAQCIPCTVKSYHGRTIKK